MQNDAAHNTVDRNDGLDHRLHDIQQRCSCKMRVHRTWFFWSFLLIPILVVLGWMQYVPFDTMPLPGVDHLHPSGPWGEWMRYYIWLQFVWLPANMVIFLIWCALGVRIWNWKHQSHPC